VNRDDAVKLLAIASAFDNRKPNEAQAIAWAEVLDGLDPRDCVEAIKGHYKESKEYLMPAHIVSRARMMMLDRRDRQTAEEHLAIMAAPERPELTEQAMEGVKAALAEPKVYAQSDRANECPWCKAKPGRGCVTPVTNRPISGVHPSRLEVVTQ
jgi:hypothetical protein